MQENIVPHVFNHFYSILIDNLSIVILALSVYCIICAIVLIASIICCIYLTTQFTSRCAPPKGESRPLMTNANVGAGTLEEVLKNSLREVYGKWEKIGHGASGTVFKCLWKGKVVAVKIFSSNRLSLGGRDKVTFIKELGIMRDLKHRHVVRLHGCHLQGTELGIVMEYCSGGSLFDFLKSGKAATAPKRTILDMARQICEGMHYLHSKNLIHRDLKPDNVLLQDSKTVKIADFGLARYLDRSTENTRLTMGVGTSYYVSPQVMKRHYYTDKCDVYSFGMMLFELFSGKLDPFRSSGVTRRSFDWKVQMRAARDPGFRPDISLIQRSRFSEYTKLIQQCWDDKEKERPSFKDMIRRFSLSPCFCNGAVNVVIHR